MQDFKNLRVWQKAHQLGINAYALPEYLQEPRGWAMRDQILKAVISISSNIAERRRTWLRSRFLQIPVVLDGLVQRIRVRPAAGPQGRPDSCAPFSPAGERTFRCA